MNSSRRTATIAGALFLIAMLASLVGGAMVDGVLAGPNPLARAAGDSGTLSVGVILELVNALAVVGIAVMLFPLFRRDGEGAALGYVALRILEAVALTAAAFLPMTLATLGEQAAGADASFGVLGDGLVAARAGLLGNMVPLFFCLGALLLYRWLYRSAAVPRFVPIWGFVGVAGIAVLNVIDVGTTTAMILALPIILNEIFLGGWLLFRGFGASAGHRRDVVAT